MPMAEIGETFDDCMAQVKSVEGTPHPTFEQTCDDIGFWTYEIVQLASLPSDTLSQGTVG